MSKKLKILVVEDEASLSKVLSAKLQKENFLVTIAANGTEAVKELESDKFDLILLDIIMPKMDGFAFLQKIREDKNETPVIIVSNLGQEEDRGVAKKYNVMHYFVKSDSNLQSIVSYIQENFL
ncbi:response regulator [Candidatus Parcubacteria bacterium]|jgi:DNA-binding response OmpR family regulator|nr:response regulator [Candidatus Parcubacteria bacterium]MBT7228579.1 response regulator [Candidatus Parcubacteria bacterium]